MKALVTGWTGFIGRNVVELLLANGHSVRLFSRKPEVPERFRGRDIEIFQGDLKDSRSVLEALNSIEVFYHVGEIKNVTRSASEKNVRLMEQITGNLSKKRVRRFVFVSSISVAGIPSEIPATEDSGPKTILEDYYTSYKRTCEKLIAQQCYGLEYVIIRPAFAYGPGSRYLGRLITAVEKLGPLGFPFIGNARNLMPLIYVEDLAKAIYLSGTQSGAPGRTLNITDGIRHSWYDFLNTIADMLGKRLRIVSLPALLLRFPALFLDLFSGVFGWELDLPNYITYFSNDIFFDNSKAKQSLGWEPVYTDLSVGIRKMIDEYKDKTR
jgi:nucleoside-diphosphate-sugar epimerase